MFKYYLFLTFLMTFTRLFINNIFIFTNVNQNPHGLKVWHLSEISINIHLKILICSAKVTYSSNFSQINIFWFRFQPAVVIQVNSEPKVFEKRCNQTDKVGNPALKRRQPSWDSKFLPRWKHTEYSQWKTNLKKNYSYRNTRLDV